MNAMSLAAWARAADVSRPTIYTYLRDPDALMPSTRSRVEAAAAKLKIVLTAPGKKMPDSGQTKEAE